MQRWLTLPAAHIVLSPSCHTSLCRILQVSGGGDLLLGESSLLLCFSPICQLPQTFAYLFPPKPTSFFWLSLLSLPFYFNVSVYRCVCPVLIRYKPNNNKTTINRKPNTLWSSYLPPQTAFPSWSFSSTNLQMTGTHWGYISLHRFSHFLSLPSL